MSARLQRFRMRLAKVEQQLAEQERCKGLGPCTCRKTKGWPKPNPECPHHGIGPPRALNTIKFINPDGKVHSSLIIGSTSGEYARSLQQDNRKPEEEDDDAQES